MSAHTNTKSHKKTHPQKLICTCRDTGGFRPSGALRCDLAQSSSQITDHSFTCSRDGQPPVMSQELQAITTPSHPFTSSSFVQPLKTPVHLEAEECPVKSLGHGFLRHRAAQSYCIHPQSPRPRPASCRCLFSKWTVGVSGAATCGDRAH